MFSQISAKYEHARKLIAVIAVASATVASLTTLSIPANASTPFEITYGGNTIGTAVPANQTKTRGVAFDLPAASAVTGARTGYAFGGWSLSVGGPALTSPYTYTGAATTDNNRLNLFAVWNTTVNYNLNGADSGSLPAGKVSDPYRFGQVLTLPTSGTAVKAGFAFGGWMPSPISTTRSTTYQAASSATGNPILYAAWIKTVSFNGNGATAGTIPAAMTYVAGGDRLKLPSVSEMTLRKPGYSFVGWSTSPTGSVVSSADSYVPVVSQRSLFAIWKIQSTKATARVFFNPGKSTLRAAQKLILRDLADSLDDAKQIKIAASATRASRDRKSLGKARNTAVVNYLRSLGVEATFTRTNTVGKGRLSTATKNNRVTLQASWVNN